MAGNSNELGLILPIILIDTQREKSTIVKDIDEMVKKEVEKNDNTGIIEMVNVLFGIYETFSCFARLIIFA